MTSDNVPFDRFDLEYLTKDCPPLEKIDSNETVSNAIQMMCKKNYSQLPIIEKTHDGKETCVGVVTALSFLDMLTKELAKGNKTIDEIMQTPVKWFKEPNEPIYAESRGEILDYIDLLSKHDFLLKGSRNRCDSMLTKTDVVNFFINKTKVFLLLREIETSLRFIICICLGKEKLQQTLDLLSSHRKEGGNNTPICDIEDLSQDELKSTINVNWDTFENYFKDKNKTNTQLDYIRELRNKVFHFHSHVTESELTHIKKLNVNFVELASYILDCG